MRLRIANWPDFASGVAFVAIGSAFCLAASRYEFGSAAQMGPAQFPVLVGGLLALFGLVTALRSLAAVAQEEKIEPIAFRPLVLVLGSVTLFALMLQPLGLVVSSLSLVLIGALASHEFRLGSACAAAAVLTAACYLIFIVGLGLPMPVLPGSY